MSCFIHRPLNSSFVVSEMVQKLTFIIESTGLGHCVGQIRGVGSFDIRGAIPNPPEDCFVIHGFK